MDQAVSNSITISQLAHQAVAADTLHTALCNTDGAERDIVASLGQLGAAMRALAATHSPHISDIRAKAIALRTCLLRTNGVERIEDDYGVAASLVNDLCLAET